MPQRIPSIALVVVLSAIATSGHASFARDTYRFTARKPQVGDRSQQELRFLLDVKMTVSQSGQIVYTSDGNVERTQSRKVELLETREGKATKAKVTFDTSEQVTSQKDRPATIAQLPVAGKTYLAQRVGEDLVITDEQGNKPSDEELALITPSMEALGRPNPLAAFFDGRTVEVGETVRLPIQVAKELFGSWDQLGEVSQLDLMLLGTQTVEGAKCALFHTKIEVKPPKSNGGATQIQGRFLIEIDTCRTAQVELAGPLSTSQVRGEGQSQFTVKRRGSMEIAVQMRHDGATR
jgi:hypothetical protein